LHHGGSYEAGQVEYALEVDVDDGIPHFIGHLLDERVSGDARVVHEYVDSPVLFKYLLHGRLAACRIGHIEADKMYIFRLEGEGLQIARINFGPLRCKPFGALRANACRTARDKCNFSVQTHDASPLMKCRFNFIVPPLVLI
jgi:hypothetical protein